MPVLHEDDDEGVHGYRSLRTTMLRVYMGACLNKDDMKGYVLVLNEDDIEGAHAHV